jgi:lauroyl/myristoyl acyltransferase
VRVLRPKLSRRIADWIARRIANQAGNPTVEALRENQSIIRGLPPDDPEVEAAIKTILRHSTHSFVTLFETMRHGFEGLSRVSTFDEQMLTTARNLIDSGTGLLYAGCHMVGFDQLLLLMGSLGYPIQVLANQEIEGSYSFLNQIRRRFGANLSPIGYRSLREAILNLRGGGIVLTGVDRPDAEGELLEFFGKQARLPVGHARLALQAGAPIMAGASYVDEDGKYRAVSCEVIQTKDYRDQPGAEIAIAQRVIRAHEQFIRNHMDEWMMFHPVWRELSGAS